MYLGSYKTLSIRKNLYGLVVLLLALVLVACGGGSGNETATLQSITVTPATSSIAAGLTQQFVATGNYSDGTSQVIATPAWSSSSGVVATVNSTGLATSLATGNSTITAAFGGLTGSTTLTVTAATLQSITVTPSSSSVAAGLTQQFTATGNYSDGTSQVIATPTWSSSSGVIATVNSTGLVTSLATGNSTITAAFGGLTGSTTLTVTAATLQSITVTPPLSSVAAGLTQQFTATGNYSDGTSQVIATPTWASSDNTIATVSSAGLVSSLKSGKIAVVASFNGVVGGTSLTVTSAVLQSISVAPDTAGLVGMAGGSTQQFTATGNYSDGTSQVVTMPTWTSSDNTVATVNSMGLVTAVGAGNFTITATKNGLSGISSSVAVFVIPAPPIW